MTQYEILKEIMIAFNIEKGGTVDEGVKCTKAAEGIYNKLNQGQSLTIDSVSKPLPDIKKIEEAKIEGNNRMNKNVC